MRRLLDWVDNQYDASRIISSALASLQPREERVIRCRYGLGKVGFSPGEQTLDEIGKALSVTKERIRQIESKSLRKLRNSISLALAQKATFKRSREIYHHPSLYKPPVRRALSPKIVPAPTPKWVAEIAALLKRERKEMAWAYVPDAKPAELIAATEQFETMIGKVVLGQQGPMTRSGHRYIEVINDWVEFRSDRDLILSLNKETDTEAVTAWLSTVMKLAGEIPRGILHWRIKPYFVYPGRVYSRFVITKDEAQIDTPTS